LLLSSGDFIFFYNSAEAGFSGKIGSAQSYNVGWVILSGNDPSIILARSTYPLLSPVFDWEKGTGKYPCNVANVIFRRFLELYGGEEPTPAMVLATDPTALRGIGLSNNKVSYILNVASFCMEHKITDKKLQKMDNESIVELLTEIKGVGKWTVEMLLMFSLGREDVFAVDDLGIQQAMIRLYKLDNTDKKAFKEKMLQLSAKWSPYRTYACMHLWQWKDDK
jgi:DNA-3-methyladenine glycosylase II